MPVNAGRRRISLDARYAYPGKLGGGLPVAPPGKAFLVDDNGNFLLDDNGSYIVVELA